MRFTLFSRRHPRRQVAKTLGHLAPALILLLGIGPLVSGTEPLTLLTVLEIAVGLTYLVLMVREWRHLRHNPFHQERIAWLELAAAAILGVEAYHLWHRQHVAAVTDGIPRRHLLPGLYAVVGVAYVVLAFRARALTKRLHLQLHPEGFAVRTSHFARPHYVHWTQVAAIEPVGSDAVQLRDPNGHARLITFAGFHEATAHRDRLLAHALNHVATGDKTFS